MAGITLKRIYEKPKRSDGFRVLADRLWPRGISKSKAKIDLWSKEIAPSNQLRRWFAHDEKKWAEFKRRYKTELENKKDLVVDLKRLSKKHKTLTLLYGAKNKKHNQAVVIKELLEN